MPLRSAEHNEIEVVLTRYEAESQLYSNINRICEGKSVTMVLADQAPAMVVLAPWGRQAAACVARALQWARFVQRRRLRHACPPAVLLSMRHYRHFRDFIVQRQNYHLCFMIVVFFCEL